MKVKVLYKGKPLAFQKLQAMYEGYSKNDESSAYVSTNREGVADIRIDHWGAWVIKTRLDTTPSDELKDKYRKIFCILDILRSLIQYYLTKEQAICYSTLKRPVQWR